MESQDSGPIDKHVDMRQSPMQISFDFPPSPESSRNEHSIFSYYILYDTERIV